MEIKSIMKMAILLITDTSSFKGVDERKRRWKSNSSDADKPGNTGNILLDIIGPLAKID